MNRRGFFKALAATAAVAFATQTRFAQTALRLVEDRQAAAQRYVDWLAQSLIETKETFAANVLNNAFNDAVLYGHGSIRMHYDEATGSILTEHVPVGRFHGQA